MSTGFDTLPDREFVRRQRFRLGEYRRRRYRDRRADEVTRSPTKLGRAPDYVGIGVQRAGTSRWHELLVAHPDVAEVTDPAGRAVKEIHWFDQPLSADGNERAQAYHGWFQAPADKVIGEWTPRYLYDLWPLDHIRETSPDTKLLIMLRDPIERLRSALQFYAERGVGLDRDTVRESMWRGMYGVQLEYVFNLFPREQVFVGLYEEGVSRPVEFLESIYTFLDLDPTFRPADLHRRVNASRRTTIDPAIFTPARSLYSSDRATVEALLPEIDFLRWG